MQNTRLCLWWNRPPSTWNRPPFRWNRPPCVESRTCLWNGPHLSCGIARLWMWSSPHVELAKVSFNKKMVCTTHSLERKTLFPTKTCCKGILKQERVKLWKNSVFNTQFTTKKVNLNLDLRQYAFLNNNLLNFEKTQLLTQNGVKQSLQQQRCLAGKTLRKTTAYNKKIVKTWKKAVFNTKLCKTDIAVTKVFLREHNAKHKVMFMVESPTFVCEIAHLVWNRPLVYGMTHICHVESPTLCGIARLWM